MLSKSNSSRMITNEVKSIIDEIELLISKRKKIEKRDIQEILGYAEPAIKSLSQLHQKLLVRKHFEEVPDKKILHILVRIDEIIAQAVALIKNKEKTKLPQVYTSIDHTINREYMSSAYRCIPPYMSLRPQYR